MLCLASFDLLSLPAAEYAPTFKSFSTPLLSRAGLGHVEKERTSSVTTTGELYYQANRLLYLVGLLMLPPLEDSLTGVFYPGWNSLHRFYSLSVAVRHRHGNLTVLTGLCWQETKHLCVPGKIEVEAAWPKPIQPASFFQV